MRSAISLTTVEIFDDETGFHGKRGQLLNGLSIARLG